MKYVYQQPYCLQAIKKTVNYYFYNVNYKEVITHNIWLTCLKEMLTTKANEKADLKKNYRFHHCRTFLFKLKHDYT